METVFKHIIGKDKTSGDQTGGDNRQSQNPCADELARIKIISDFKEPGKSECKQKRTMAVTLDGDDDEKNPSIIVCDTGLKHGGIKKGYDVGVEPPGPGAVTCDTIGERTTWRMETLGSILLHEYT